MENNEHSPRKERTLAPSSGLFEWTEAIVTSLAFVLLVFTFFIHTNTVVGGSMTPTLLEGDRLLVTDFLYHPSQGDIVIISKKTFRTSPIVKRVIAVEGQTVDIDFEKHEVYVNGNLLDEPYINEPTARSFDMTFPVTVPEGCVFVMGDNRNASDDSRDSQLGFVDERYIQGRVFLRYWPFNVFGVIGSADIGE